MYENQNGGEKTVDADPLLWICFEEKKTGCIAETPAVVHAFI